MKHFDVSSDAMARRSKARWDTMYAGTPAINTLTDSGYRVGAIFYRYYLSHRVAWCIHHSEWPEEEIDHINGIRDDNRLCNLRPASANNNAHNKGIQKNNTSGYKGVTWHKRIGEWQSSIRLNIKGIHLGYFNDAYEAHLAYQVAANSLYGEFKNYGEFNEA